MAVYKGLAFPLKKSELQIPSPATDDELIRQSIFQIIMTGEGERVMRPEFGSGTISRIFDNNDALLAESLKFQLQTAITKYEPRAMVQNISVTREDTTVTIEIQFVVIATRNSMTIEAQFETSQG